MERHNMLRQLPAIGVLLSNKVLVTSGLPRWALTQGAQEAVSQARQDIRHGGLIPDVDEIASHALALARAFLQPSLRRVINATGVVLHTNLGRAPLSDEAAKRVSEVAMGYSNLEYDIKKGRRGSRRVHAQDLLCRLTGAEAAMVVNNNAAAVFLALAALAKNKKVLVSRGELVEIGGSFRIPDILEAGGCTLKEVGSTNRTRLSDYERAIDCETALLLKVHTSNFTIRGFTESVKRAELVALGQKRHIPVMEDLGSGMLAPMSLVRGMNEPLVSQVVKSGVDLITFSGDKLVGGPQAGIILGKASYIEMLAKHPLARAVRVGKMTLAALESTLAAYSDGRAEQDIPVVEALNRSAVQLAEEAGQLLSSLQSVLLTKTDAFHLGLRDSFSQAGGGSLPELSLPTTCVSLRPRQGSLQELEIHLRCNSPCIVARIQDDHLLLDPRTLRPGDGEVIGNALMTFIA